VINSLRPFRFFEETFEKLFAVQIFRNLNLSSLASIVCLILMDRVLKVITFK
jgi:hypothetical protein